MQRIMQSHRPQIGLKLNLNNTTIIATVAR